MNVQQDQIFIYLFKDVLTETRLETSLYRKPTDRSTLIHGSSYRTVPLKRSLPISQFSRIRRICSGDEDYQRQAEILAGGGCTRRSGFSLL